MGIVTNFSTSSALLPGHCVMTLISVLVTSGKASMGMLLKVKMPRMNIAKDANNMKYLFLSEKAMMLLIILTIINVLNDEQKLVD